MTTEDAPSEETESTDISRLGLRYAARSDIGLVRQGNEDSGYAGAHMLVVADGMGGHAAGELASATAVAMFAELDLDPPQDEFLAAMADAVENAHDELARIISDSPDFAGMGTTVTAMAWLGTRVGIAHVGDSRAYLLRDGVLTQLTKDHTFVQTLVDSGRITEEQAHVHEKRNLLIKALDGLHVVEPDLSMREVRAGDRFLLCSDGLCGVLTKAEIQERLATGDPTGTVTALVERALEAGAPDNVTCVVADVVLDESMENTLTDGQIRMPVVVGAAAEPRNRDRLPGIPFPDDAQPDPDRPTPPPSVDESSTVEEAVPVVGKRRRGGRWLIAAITGVLLILAALVGTWTYVNNQYYIGTDNDKVAIYQGVTWGPGDHGFSHAIQTSQTAVANLPIISQDAVNQTIPAANLDAARTTLAKLEAQAQICLTKPIQPGCPDESSTQTPAAKS